MKNEQSEPTIITTSVANLAVVNSLANSTKRNLVIFEIIDKCEPVPSNNNEMVRSTNTQALQRVQLKACKQAATSTADTSTTLLSTASTSAVITKKPGTGIILLSQASLNDLFNSVELNINNNHQPEKKLMAIVGDGVAGFGGSNQHDHPNHIHHSEQSNITNTNNSYSNNIITNHISSKSQLQSILMINSSTLPCTSVGTTSSSSTPLMTSHLTGDKQIVFALNNNPQVCNIAMYFKCIILVHTSDIHTQNWYK